MALSLALTSTTRPPPDRWTGTLRTHTQLIRENSGVFQGSPGRHGLLRLCQTRGRALLYQVERSDNLPLFLLLLHRLLPSTDPDGWDMNGVPCSTGRLTTFSFGSFYSCCHLIFQIATLPTPAGQVTLSLTHWGTDCLTYWKFELVTD